MTRRTTFTPSMPTAAAVLRVLDSIQARVIGDPALVAFNLALARMGREARDAGGAAALTCLVREVRTADAGRAADRVALLRAAWGRTRGSRGGVAVRQRRQAAEMRAAA